MSPTHNPRPRIVFTSIAAGILAITLQACSGSPGGDGGTPPPAVTATSTFNVKDAVVLYTTATPISTAQLQTQTGLAAKSPTSGIPTFIDGRTNPNPFNNNTNNTNITQPPLIAALSTNSKAFNLVSVDSNGVSHQTIESIYLNRVLYTLRPPVNNGITGKALGDPHVYIAFSSQAFDADANDYSEFIRKNAAQPCALYAVNTSNNSPACVLANVEPVPFFDNSNDGSFDTSNRKSMQFDAEGNIYLAGYPFTVGNDRVAKSSKARLYKIQKGSFLATPLTQDNESVAFFTVLGSGDPVVALKRDTGSGVDLALIQTKTSPATRHNIAFNLSQPFVNVDTYRSLIYGSDAGTDINLVRTSSAGVERASLDYYAPNNASGSHHSLQSGGKTYTGLKPRRVIAGDDGKFYTVYTATATDGSSDKTLLVYQTLPFARDPVVAIPFTGDWWAWLKSRPIQVKRGLLYHHATLDRANSGYIDIIKVVRLNDGKTQTLLADRNYRIDNWKALGDTLYFSGLENSSNKVIQGQVNTKRIAQQSDWSSQAWAAFTPVNTSTSASALSASFAVQDLESLAPQQPLSDTGLQPAILAFDSTEKTALISFTKYMDKPAVEGLLQASPKEGGAASALFPLWAYQNVYLVYDTSNGLKDGLADAQTSGLPVGGKSYELGSTDNLPDAYGWSTPPISYKVVEKQNGIYGLYVPASLLITSQPSDQTVTAGQTASFAVAATATAGSGTVRYQWKKNGADIKDATNSSYTTPATVLDDDSAIYAVAVSNADGTLMSSNVTLYVTPAIANAVPAPVISSQPASQTINAGQTATFNVSATHGSLTYQWKKNSVDIPDATNSSYTTVATSFADNGAVFTVNVSNATGSVSSGGAVLTVNSPPVISTQPANQSVTAGQTATFTVAVTGTEPLAYQWRKNGSNISGATSSSYTTPETVGADSGAVFTVAVSNAFGSVVSGGAVVTVNAQIDYGGTYSCTFDGDDKGTITAVAPSPFGDFSTCSGKSTNGGVFSCTGRIASNGVISGNTSTGTVLTGNAVGGADNAAAQGSWSSASYRGTFACTRSRAAASRYSLVANGSGGFYDKTECVMDNSTGLVWEGKTASPATSRLGTSYYTNYDSTNIPQKYQGNVYVTQTEIDARTNSIGYKNSVNASALCGYTDWRMPTKEELQGIKVSGSHPTIDSAWFPNTQAYFYWSSSPYVGVSNDAWVVDFATSIVLNHGRDYSRNFVRLVRTTLAVNPAPVAPAITAPPASQSVIAGQSATFTVTASGTAPLGYQWKKNGSDISGATSSIYTTPATSSADNGAVYSVTVSNSAGTVTSNSATLTANPAPVAPSFTVQPASQSVSAGQSATFTATATGTAPLSYQWKKNGNTIAGATASSYTTAATSVADSGAVFTVVVSNSVGSVTSNSATLTVNPASVAPAITAQPASQSVITGETASFSVTATGTAPLSYQWKKNGSDISGATSSSFTTAATVIGDSGAVFTVVVSNGTGTVTSSSATLSVFATKYSEVANASGGTYARTECVKDNITGLIWEGKTASPATSRLGTSTYTNYDGDGHGQKSGGGNASAAEINASTNSIGYKNSVNTSALCGYTDWRMPTKEELEGILASSGSPRIDTAWFPNTRASFYWSSSPYVGGSVNAWYVGFNEGYVGGSDGVRFYGLHVRLVR